MNIIFLIGALRFSGAENVLRCIAPSIASKGHNVEIMVMTEGWENEELPGVKITTYGSKGNALQRRIGRCKNIRKEIARFSADLVVGFGFPMNFDAIVGAKGTRAKSLICERMDPYTKIRSLSYRLQKSILYPLANGYAVQTPKIKEYYVNNYSSFKPVSVIPNPVRKTFSEKRVRDEGVEDYLINVARLDDAQKNQTMLIKSFSIVSKSFPNLKLHLAGSGRDLDKYKELVKELGIEDRVVFLGNLEDPTEAVRNSKLFLLSSNHEGMPNALIEAMAQGKACVSTRCSGGGAEYLIQDGENGLLVDIGDTEGFANAIIKLLNDNNLREKIENNALKLNHELSIDVIADEWIRCFEGVIKK
jgi:glycosyltransferase involved in cell wall biosynthesis